MNFMSKNWSAQQNAIFAWFRNASGNLIVRARVRRRREDKKVAGWAPGQPWEIGDIDALENTLSDEEE
jgi:hypothetical protein